MYLEAFSAHFGQIEDQRQTAKVTYPLFDILFVTFCGVIAGAEGCADIRDYAECHHNWFKERGVLADGIPVTTQLLVPFHVLNQRSLAPALSTGCRMSMN